MARSTLTDDQAHHERQIREANEAVLAATALLEVRVIAAREQGMPWTLMPEPEFPSFSARGAAPTLPSAQPLANVVV